MRRLARVAGSILALGTALSREQPAQPFVPVAVAYDVEAPRGPNQVKRDLDAIRALGFNSVKAVVKWSRAEAARQTYRFDALDQLLALAEQADLRTIVEMDTSAAPPWLLTSYPDARFVSDRHSIPSNASPYCLDHPAVRTHVETFLRKATERLSTHAGVYAIDVGLNPPAGLCTCPHSRRSFSEWLSSGGARPVPSQVAPIDEATFAALGRRDELKMRVDSSVPRGARLTTAHVLTPSVFMAGRPQGDDWLLSGLVDQYGTELTPRQSSDRAWHLPEYLAMVVDGIRSATRDRGWWASAIPVRDVTPAEIRHSTWTALSRGARALGYSDIVVGKRVLPAAAARAAGDVAGVISRNPALFAPLRPRASQVAIVYNPLPRLTSREIVAGPSPSSPGFYFAMLERNIQTDFVSLDEIVAGLAARYRAVFLGNPLVLTQPVADALKTYVAAGGTLISEGRLASRNERGRAATRVPGAGLDEVFGALVTSLRSATDVTMTAQPDLDGPLASVAGRAITGRQFVEHLSPTRATTRVLARFQDSGAAPGDPAIVMSGYGKGRAILIGTLLATRSGVGARSADELFAGLVALGGVTPEVRIEGATGLVETRYLESSDVIMFIALNHTPDVQRVTFRFAPDTQEAIWQNMMSGTAVNFVATPNGPRSTHTIGPKDALVLMIRKHIR